jgi:uncharacterized membrane protein YbhN (UPF0104 family)
VNRFTLWILRIFVSALLLAIIFWFLPAGDVWAAIRNVPLALWLAVLVAFLLAHVVAAVKWWLLTDQSEVPLGSFVRAHFVGLMGNLCLPGVVGGDVVRCGWMLRTGISKARLGVACLEDRLLDTVSLFTLSIAGALITAEGNETAERVLVSVGACLAAGLAVVAVLCGWLLSKRPSGPKLDQLIEALENSLSNPWILIRSFILSLTIQTCFVCLSIVLGAYTGVNIGVSVWFLAWPLAKLAAFAPVTLGGLGVRESALILLMEPFGALAPAIAAASLLWQTVLFAGGLVGGMIALSHQYFAVASRHTDKATIS